MAILIKKAESIKEINDVLRLRYLGLEESGKNINKLFSSTRKVSDFFDVYPDTLNMVAYDMGSPIATIRAVPYEDPQKVDVDFSKEEHDLLNEVFDYSDSFSRLKGITYFIDIVAIGKEYSLNELLIQSLFKGLLNILATKKIDFIFLNIPSKFELGLKDIGFKEVAKKFKSQTLKEDVTPSFLDIRGYYDSFVEKIKDREILRFQETFYYIVYEAGEICMTQGEKGATALLVESGALEVLLFKDENVIPVASIGVGNLVGEIGLVTNEKRTASMMARTQTSCIAFDREFFLGVMRQQPNKMVDMFKIFSKRIRSTNEDLAKLKKGLNK
jgi:CRP-like cAMP-binding protein